MEKKLTCVLTEGKAEKITYYFQFLEVVQAWLANWSLSFRYFYTGIATELFNPFIVAGSFVYNRV